MGKVSNFFESFLCYIFDRLSFLSLIEAFTCFQSKLETRVYITPCTLPLPLFDVSSPSADKNQMLTNKSLVPLAVGIDMFLAEEACFQELLASLCYICMQMNGFGNSFVCVFFNIIV